ncbi:hypothetical protein MLD38_008209 [Melastoma candidum]|uniref:Uncharacterized protein n=1 Tax=Melastoma candidum TaxID=119954 RepID=A0ACB9RU42_9MYRT|nr:hypothetical protein MLD38_008209 [Melastoma candidum]
MGYLLKEALKTMCGVKQWDYAVFWKIGCHNPKLLIWEECYYEPPLCIIPQPSRFENNQVPSGGQREGCLAPMTGLHASEKVQLLVERMMIKNQIIVMGEGIIGRSAFTGNHQWISAGSFSRENHPPEVLSQLHHQFASGMQTIVVIPVKCHGLVQLGSSLALRENNGFVDEVRSLILQLGLVPGALLSDNYLAPDAARPSLPVPPNKMSRVYNCTNSNDFIGGLIPSSLANVHPVSGLSGGLGDCDNSRLSSKIAPPQLSADGCAAFDVHKFLENTPLLEGIGLFNGMNQVSMPLSIFDKGASSFCETEKTSFLGNPVHLEGVPLLRVNNPMTNGWSSVPRKTSCRLGGALKSEIDNLPSNENTADLGVVLEQCDSGTNSTISTNLKYEEQSFGHALGDDLFDILGSDYKQKILSAHTEKAIANDWNAGSEKLVKNTSNYGKIAESSLDYLTVRDGMSESCVFDGSGSDDLLDAVVSGTFSKQCSDGNMSCNTTLTKANSVSVPSSSPVYAHFAPKSNQTGGGYSEFAKTVGKSATSMSCSDVSGHSKERTCPRSDNSFGGSQISSWVEQCHFMKHENSVVPSGFSKRPGGETVKPGRKRLKPGENPRPRPKDRQMIQDRLKELRELVPSGAKCSIDALLERTVKHMLFLQSVTKHADKLKQTRESKIRDKEGGLLLKDNFEGGATWAFEVGSQSMICPIIVEDLSHPRQMLVEMLCQERGLFLEIADAIRGMGLTILKGVMETRDDKIRAQFAVEANRDVTRMEIFMSLIHLLEKSGKSIPTPANAIESDHQMIHRSLSTGIPAGLQ